MGLKIIESYDSSFTLSLETKKILFKLLTNEVFIQQLSQQLSQQVSNAKLEFTELIFQPVPYSSETPKGMPQEFEIYHRSTDHLIINVPPNFMFQAKIFKPSRLCAIYRKLV